MPPRPTCKGLLSQGFDKRGRGDHGEDLQDEDGADVPSLKKMCTSLLIACRDELRDVGEVDSALLRPILEACSVQQLKLIEGETRLGSGRSLKWDTWDIWRRHYLRDHGQPDLSVKVPPIMTAKPADYDKTSRPVDSLVPGDWRKLYEETSKEMLTKQDDTALRMRMRYSQANQIKQRRTATIDAVDAPLPKRRSTGSSWGSAPSQPMTSKDRLSAKLGLKKHGESYRSLGASAPGGKSQARSSGGALRQQQLAAAKPVSRLDRSKPSAIGKLRQKMRATSAPPAGRAASSSSGGSSRPSLTPQKRPVGSRMSLTPPPASASPMGKRPAATPKPPPARMDIGSMISGMKASINKQYNNK